MTSGQLAARVFRMIDAGKDLREIVVELEQPPPVVRALYREWLDDFAAGEARRIQVERAVDEARARAVADRRDESEARALERRIQTIFGRSG
jgi:hypothetical protein